jgi:hypothetical protein
MRCQSIRKLLAFYNHDHEANEVIHWCLPNCCTSQGDFEVRSREHALLLLGRPPPAPLLYRWKHFDAATSFSLRGVCVHGIYVRVISSALSKEVVADESLDENGEMSPAAKQQWRLSGH